MRKDPTEFRKRFNRWKAGEKVYNAGRPEYDKYIDKLAEKKAEEWARPPLKRLDKEEVKNHILSDDTYDYRAQFEEDRPGANMNLVVGGHFPDTYKTAKHPTFSDESKYSGWKNSRNPKGINGGHWNGEKFTPSWEQFENGRFDEWDNLNLPSLKEVKNVEEFYKDYNNRYLKQHPTKTSSVQKALNLPVKIEDLPYGIAAEYYNSGTWVGPDAEYFYEPSWRDKNNERVIFPLRYKYAGDLDKDIVHEISHAVRENGGDGATYVTGEWGDTKQLRTTGLNPTETKLLNEAYPLDFVDKSWLDPKYSVDAEGAATNTELRYVLWKQLQQDLGRSPSEEELNEYINKYDDQQLLNLLFNINGYGLSLTGKKLNVPVIKTALQDVAMNDVALPLYKDGKSLFSDEDAEIAASFIAKNEKFMPEVYRDYNANQEEAKRRGKYDEEKGMYYLPTAGYGWTSSEDLHDWTEKDAHDRLLKDVHRYNQIYSKSEIADYYNSLSGTQRAALIDLMHQGGVNILSKMPKFVKHVKNGNKYGMMTEFNYAATQTPNRAKERRRMLYGDSDDHINHVELPDALRVQVNKIMPVKRHFDLSVPYASTIGDMLDEFQSKRGLHRENIDGKWTYALPEITVVAPKKKSQPITK